MAQEPEITSSCNFDDLLISKPLSVAEFAEEVQTLRLPIESNSLISDTLRLNDFEQEIEEIDPELLDELHNVTNPITSLYPADYIPFTPIELDQVPNNVKLSTVKLAKQYFGNAKNPKYKRYSKYPRFSDEQAANTIATVKYENAVSNKRKEAIEKGCIFHKKIRDVSDVIIKAKIYKPAQSYESQDKKLQKSLQQSAIRHMINLLSSNTLAQFKDAIVCDLDHCIPGDWGDNPNGVGEARTAQSLFPSSVLFIEDMFYVDDRVAREIFRDYSFEIRKWLKDQGLNGDLPVRSMTHTKMSDLTIKLGHPYMYMHQGHCQHVFVFSEMRAATCDDCIYEDTYPLPVKRCYAKIPICNTCQNREVKWMIKNSTMLPNDPAHQCDMCFKMLHYKQDGSKVCDFKAFIYKDFNMVTAGWWSGHVA